MTGAYAGDPSENEAVGLGVVVKSTTLIDNQ